MASRQRQLWLLPAPQILHSVNGSDCLQGFQCIQSLSVCRLASINCPVWLYVGDYAIVWWGSFCFYEQCDFGHHFDPVEDVSSAATWQKILKPVMVFSLHWPCPDPPILSCTQILTVVLPSVLFLSSSCWAKVMRWQCGRGAMES